MVIAIEIIKQQVLDADPKAIQQINFFGNVARETDAYTTMFFVLEEAIEPVLDFSQGTARVLIA